MREGIMTEILLESNILIDSVLHEENYPEYKGKTAMGNEGHESQTDACFADLFPRLLVPCTLEYGTMRPVLGGLNRRFPARLQTESVRPPLTSSATESKRCYSTSRCVRAASPATLPVSAIVPELHGRNCLNHRSECSACVATGPAWVCLRDPTDCAEVLMFAQASCRPSFRSIHGHWTTSEPAAERRVV